MRHALLLGFLLLAATPLHADSTAVLAIQESAPTFEAGRDRLIDLARGAEASSPELSADAWLAAGKICEYLGQGDSAIVCYRRAVERRGAAEELLRAMDALFRRAARGDAEECLRLADRIGAAPGGSDLDKRTRQAWAWHLNGRSEEAWKVFSRIDRALSQDPLWLLRMGQVAFHQGQDFKAYGYLHSVCMASRGASDEARKHVIQVLDRLGTSAHFDDELAYQLGRRAVPYDAYVKGFGARRIRFSGRDRAPLGGALFAPDGSRRLPGVVALIAPDDSLPSWDSLGVRLREAGFAALFVDGRGSRTSISPNCPLPAAWAGRRGAMTRLTAEDASEGFRALGLAARVDTTRYTLIAAGTSVYAALLAAEADPRIESLVLVSPEPERFERGPAIEIARRIRVPIFFVQSRLDRLNGQWLDPLYRAAPGGVSRVADETRGGPGPDALRSDAIATERLTRWLREKKPARAKAAPPRGERRPG